VKRKPEIPIHCAFTRLVPLAEVKPNPRNPNTHPDSQLDLYAKVIEHQGWRRAVVVSNQSGFIVTGHGAAEVAKRKGWKTVPVDFQDFASDADEKAHMLADNRIPELAELDATTTKALEDEISAAGLSLDLSGLEIDFSPEGQLVEVKPMAAPARCWFLIGFPTVRMAELQPLIDQVAALPGAYIQHTINNDNAGLIQENR
jgi:hypothetical protein